MLGHFVHQILLWVEQLGYWGIMVGLMIEVIPSEIILSYGGYLVSQDKINLIGAVIFGTIGGTIAQIFVYWIGRYGGRPFLEKYGKYILIKTKHIDVAEQWFAKYGSGVIFTARFIPVVRHAISVPAGIARMSLLRFTVYTTLAVIPWSFLFIYLGMTLGKNWQEIDKKAAPYLAPFIYSAIGLTVLYLGYKWLTRKQGKTNSNFKAGYVGEKQTAHVLEKLGADYHVLNHIRLSSRGHSQDIDHIVIGPNGVFHIETKHWTGDIIFSENGVKHGNGGDHRDPTSSMYRHEYIVKELLRANHLKADVTGVLCFTNPDCRLNGKSPAFHTVKLEQLLAFITAYNPKQPLSGTEADAIAEAIRSSSNLGG